MPRKSMLRPILSCIGRIIVAIAIIAAIGIAVATTPPVHPDVEYDNVMTEVARYAGKLHADTITSEEALADPRRRAEAAARAMPLLKRVIGLLEGSSQTNPDLLAEYRMMAATFGDGENRLALAALAVEPTPQGETAQALLLLVDWYRADRDPALQAAVLDQCTAVARKSPTRPLAAVLVRMHPHAASLRLTARIESMVADLPIHITTEAGRRLIAAHDLIGTRLVVAGTALDGSDFSSLSLEGRVVLVDFWATWYGADRKHLVEVKRAYAKYRDEGMEVLSVFSDFDRDALERFIEQDGQMPWVHLFDANAANDRRYHPIADRLKIGFDSVTLLVDRNGIVRAVPTDATLHATIRTLLDEY